MGIRIEGTTFLLKGRFDLGTKAQVRDQIVAAGGKVSKSMTAKTGFIVCGVIEEYDFYPIPAAVNSAELVTS